ncbi:MAG TPA: right-handed parallel beta-helix repeat-containing protein, partial [Ilumatobacteraceae bacterium]|nr:right-handed parallel beta-helix repeat-containing protein [Ilumatobacteraceae bacterium]
MKRSIIATVAVIVLVGCASSGESDAEQVETAGAAPTEATTEATTGATTEATEVTAPTATTVTSGGADDGTLEVPAEFDTIQAAVDAALPGDLVLISPGTYNETINVTTDEITIRGLDRNEVILDGDFELDNGIRVLGASNVIVENLTTQNYTNNGVFWTSADGYRGSYITAYRNGDYGVYAFDSVNGQLDNSYAAGSPDAGFYIGQCYPCDSVIIDVQAEHNGLGYSGTNSGGNLLIANSVFNNNRAGIVPNSGSYELCYPERRTDIIGNLVYSNNQPDTPAIDVAILAMGNGILVPGGVQNVISRNRVFDHDKTGIGLVPFLEEGANDDIPTRDEWETECAEQRTQPPAEEIPAALLWESFENTVVDNVLSDNRTADIGVAGVSVPSADLGNCFSGNEFSTTAPIGLQELAPCDGNGSGGDWEAGALNVLGWLDEVANRPPSVDYEDAALPPKPVLVNMPDAATAPARPAGPLVEVIDADALTVPPAP